jgi:hypothetical protein
MLHDNRLQAKNQRLQTELQVATAENLLLRASVQQLQARLLEYQRPKHRGSRSSRKGGIRASTD